MHRAMRPSPRWQRGRAGSVGSWSVKDNRPTPVSAAHVLVDDQVNALAQEAHGAVAKDEIRPAGMQAAETLPPIISIVGGNRIHGSSSVSQAHVRIPVVQTGH